MSGVMIFKGGKWHDLAGQSVYKTDRFETLGDNDKLYANGEWHRLGFNGANTPSSSIEQLIPDIPDIPDISSIPDITYSFSGQPETGTAWYVTPNGNGDPNDLNRGADWSHAFNGNDVNEMVAVFSLASSGDYICFAGGEYTTESYYVLPSGVSMFGGFQPDSNYSWESRSVTENPTRFTMGTAEGITAHKWISTKNATSGQVIDGFALSGYDTTIDLPSGESNPCPAKNLYINGGNCVCDAALSNTVITGCAAVNLTASGTHPNVRLLSMTGTITIVGTLSDSYINACTGLLTVGTLTSSYVMRGGAVTVTNMNGSMIHTCTGNVTISVAVSDNSGTRSGIYVLTGNISASNISKCDIAQTGTITVTGNVSDVTLSSAGNVSISGDATTITANTCGNVSISGNATTVTASSCGDVSVGGAVSDITLLNDENVSITGSAATLTASSCGDVSVTGDATTALLSNVGNLTVSGKLSGSKVFNAPSETQKTATIGYAADSVIDGFIANISAVERCNVLNSNSNTVVFSGKDSRIINCKGNDFKFYKTENKISIGSYNVVSSSNNIIGANESIGISCNYFIEDGVLKYVSGSTATAVIGASGTWTAISGYSYSSSYYAYGICNGKLYQLSGTTATQVGILTGWTTISGYYSSTYYAYGICGGILYRISGTNAVSQNVHCDKVYVSGTSVCYHAFANSGNILLANCTSTGRLCAELKNSLVLNCEATALADTAKFSTIVNSIGDVTAGTNNIFWNNTGTIPASGNAQSTNDEDNLKTLGTSNLVTKFGQTGFSSAKGAQGITTFENPGTDLAGYVNRLNSFGNFHLNSSSLLIGIGTADADIPKDGEDVTRANPPTIGAYETVYGTIAVSSATNNAQAITAELNTALSEQGITATASNSSTVSFKSSNLPSWVTLDEETGVLAGTPGTAGDYVFDVVVYALGCTPCVVEVTITVS